MPVVLFLLAVAAGLANPFQSGANAELNKQIGRPLWTGLIVYASGLAGLLLVQLVVELFLRQPIPAARATDVPWWAWLGGLISVVPTVIGLTIAQRLGSGLFTGLSLTASLVTSVLLDHYGLVGFKQHSASPTRIAGCALMIAGVWMIARF